MGGGPVLKNVGSNWIVTVVTVVAVYLLTPYTIHKLGDDGYGTWNLINSITGYLGLLVLGVPMASVRYFAQHVARGDTTKLNQAIGSCTALYLILGAVALVMGVGLYAFFTFSIYVLILHAGARLSFETDSMVIGGFMNVGSIPYFTVANSFIIYLMEFLIAIAAVVMPMATRLQTQGKKAELQEIFLKWS